MKSLWKIIIVGILKSANLFLYFEFSFVKMFMEYQILWMVDGEDEMIELLVELEEVGCWWTEIDESGSDKISQSVSCPFLMTICCVVWLLQLF